MKILKNIFLKTLENHAPKKTKILRANHVPYMTKTLRKAIMRRSQLQNKYHKNRSEENQTNYKKQKNFCSRLYKKERKKYYSTIDIKRLTDNKLFWKTIAPFLSRKGSSSSRITLVENNKVLSEDQDVANELNIFFETAVKSLNITENPHLLSDTNNLTDPVDIAIKKFEFHPSIQVIRENVTTTSPFDFTKIQLDEVYKEVSNLNSSKASPSNTIPPKLLKETSDVCSSYLLRVWNEEIVRRKTLSPKFETS